MIETSHIGRGRWGLSRITVGANGHYTSYAAEQRLADTINMHYPPMENGAYVVDVCVVRLRGNIVRPSDGNTVLLPRSLQAIGDIELGELTEQQRNALRNTLTDWCVGYQYTDYLGQIVDVPAFDATGYIATSTLKEVFRDVRRYLQNSDYRPRQDSQPADHNTLYTYDFSSATPGDDWTDMDGFGLFAHDGTNDEGDINISGGPRNIFRYDTAPGDIEHEAQITAIMGSGATWATGVVLRCHNSTTEDYYHIFHDGSDVFWIRWNAASSTTLTQTSNTGAADGDFFTIRGAAEGGNGANVVLDVWYTDHNSSSKPSDPGWIGDDASPDFTHTDTDASRLDDSSVHLHGGFGHEYESTDYDTRCDHYRVQTVSDRGGAAVTERTLSDSVVVEDTPEPVRTSARELVDSLDINSALQLARLATRRGADSVVVVDGVVRALFAARGLSEQVSAVDTSARSIEATRQLTDALSVVDALVREVLTEAVSRVLTDTVTATDAVIRTTVVGRVLSDATSIFDALVRDATGTILRTLSDAVTTSDATQAEREVWRRLINAVAVSVNDALNRQGIRGRTLADEVDTSDATELTKWLVKVLGDAVDADDALIATITYDVLQEVAAILRAVEPGLQIDAALEEGLSIKRTLH